MCHNKILDFVSGCKATGIMPILLYAILLSVAPKKMTDDRETFRTKPNGRWQPCVALSYMGIIERQRQRREEEKKKKRNRFYRCERRIEKGKSRSGRHNSIVFQKCGKNVGVTSGRHARGRFFHPFFFHFFFLLSFSGKMG